MTGVDNLQEPNRATMNTERIIRKPELLRIIGLSDCTVWRMEKEGRFPLRIRLGGNSTGWLLSEVEAWIAARAAERPKSVSND